MNRFLLVLIVLLSLGTFQTNHGQSYDTAIQALNNIFEGHDLMGISIVVVADKMPIFEYYNGYKNYDEQLEVDERTAYRIASISKNITALCAMKLVEEGLVNLDEDINNHLPFHVINPTFPNDSITLRMLLSHRSSIIDGPTYSSFLGATYSSSTPPSLAELLEPEGDFYHAQTFNQIQPGTYFNYSNLNYGLVATVLEAVSGMRFDLLCHDYIFDPLSINGGFHPAYIDDITDLSILYRKVGGEWIPQNDMYDPASPPVIAISHEYVPGTNGLYFAPQGGTRLSALDLAKIMMTHQNNGLSTYGDFSLDAGLQNEMESMHWQYNGQNGNNYWDLFNAWGLGTHITTDLEGGDNVIRDLIMYGHPGEAYGLVSGMYYEKEENLGIIYIINGNGSGYSIGSESAFYTVEREIFDALGEHVIDEWRVLSSVADDREALTPITIFPNPTDGQVHIQMEWSGQEQYRLVDKSGRTIDAGIVENAYIDVSSIVPGSYILNIVDGDNKVRATSHLIKN